MATRPHAFIVMPFGTKKGTDGETIYFDEIYRALIAPALEKAGLHAFRADDERRAGDIRVDMFQELLLADLVLADISIDNPNVWYELGVRHALRSRGVVLISGGRVNHAFDIYTDRKFRYRLKDGTVDQEGLADETEALATILRSTMESWHGRSVSPVYSLLPNLKEPDWKSLRIGSVCEYWEAHEAWKRRLQHARRQNLLGDMLLLADEAPVAALRGEALVAAGKALRTAGRYAMAYETLLRGESLVTTDTQLRADLMREQGICLDRLAGFPMDDPRHRPGFTLERVRDHYSLLLENLPDDPKISTTHGLAARVEKQEWTRLWMQEATVEARRRIAKEEKAVLQLAVNGYIKAFRVDPSNFYAGLNALTLMVVEAELGIREPEDSVIVMLRGAVRFAADIGCDKKEPFYALATLALVNALFESKELTMESFRAACAQHDSNRFALLAYQEQLSLLRSLGYRLEVIDAAIGVLDQVIQRLHHETEGQFDLDETSQAILFSGHRMDEPGRAVPRFPPELEDAVNQRLGAALDQLNAGESDIAFCQAASGGDILFLEAALARGVRCQVLLPYEEPEFLLSSVLPSCNGARWRDRYYAIKEKLTLPIREMPEALGPIPKESNAYERCSRWKLYSALACGINRLRFITVWDGEGGDGPGGTSHMMRQVKKRTGRVEWIDIRSLKSKITETPNGEASQPTSPAGEASVDEQVM
jgi:hypothetical protein